MKTTNAVIATLGIDLGKTTFHVVGTDTTGATVVRKQLSRKQLFLFTSNKPTMLIGMEACSGAHFLARALRAQGHDARLIPAQYVKPYRKTNKNDYLDAEAIAEAVTRPNMRFVPIKTDAQLDLQSLHRVRDRWVRRKAKTASGQRLHAGLDNRARPVMVWMHGGGFSAGSGNYLLYDGTQPREEGRRRRRLRNHRLNIFGFLHLAGIGGEKWKRATNVGVQDLVAALQWVKTTSRASAATRIA